MTYPLSSTVQAGDATEASQYNNLRADALYLGNDPAASGNLLQLLSGSIQLSQSGTATIVLTASESAPASLLISGVIYSVTQNLSFEMTAENFPAAGYYQIYAALESGSFSLGVAAALPNNAVKIGGLIWTGSAIVRGTLRNNAAESIAAAADPFVCNGRLTLASGSPIPVSDIDNGTTLYFTPYNGNKIGLYIGGRWNVFEFAELSLPLSSLDNDIPYDIFVSAQQNGIGLSLSAYAWGSKYARAMALSRQNGILVAGVDAGMRYVGTVAKTGGVCKDTMTARLVYNELNQLERPLLSKLETSAEGSQHPDVWAPYFDADAPEVMILCPNAWSKFDLLGVGIGTALSENDISFNRAYAVGIGRDMIKSAPYAGNTNAAEIFAASLGNAPVTVRIRNNADGIGLHTYTLAFWSNYTFVPKGTAFKGSAGECPGLSGFVLS